MDKFDPYKTRLVKLPLDISLVRQIDELVVAGIGGYTDRNDFIRDAIVGLLAETRFEVEPAPNIGPPPAHTNGDNDAASFRRFAVDSSPLVVHWPGPAPVALMEKTNYETDDVPLLGMHNRDFPSIWAATQIAEITSLGMTEANACFQMVVERAWEAGKQLQLLERPGSQRYSALFPTNQAKRDSSEANFRAFAIGRVVGNGQKRAIGPLFQWHLCGLSGSSKDLRIGLLAAADTLLRQLDGISPETPHSENHARAFLDHLCRYATADFEMIRRVLRGIEGKPTREHLVEHVASTDADWSRQQANSYTVGYVARSREWGFVEPKMIDNTYSLTAFGKDVLSEYGRKEIVK